MSMLDKVGKPADRSVFVTICGDSGMGKTTLAATFPKPIVIRAEDGLQAIPSDKRPDAFPVLTTFGISSRLCFRKITIIKRLLLTR